jgi:3-hydroxybutyrate dehydrogenase
VSRRALVTGGGRGIGRGIAHALSASGFDVAVTARSEDELVAAASSAPGPGRVVPLAADLADRAVCAEVPARAREALGGDVDAFVHAAGISRVGSISELGVDGGLEGWDVSMQVNVTSALQLAAAFVPAMTAARWGRIVSVGSLYSRFGVRSAAPYTASKHALLGFTRVIAAEVVSHGVTANTICPGWVDTEMVRGEAQRYAHERDMELGAVLKHFIRNQPIGRMVTTDEVGALVAFLCSDAAAAITGQAINVDGGSYQA